MCGGSVSKPVESTEPKFKVGDRFRVREGVGGGWDGYEATIVEVEDNTWGRRYRFEPAKGSSTWNESFSETSAVGQHAELIEQGTNDAPAEPEDPQTPKFANAYVGTALLERVTPPPRPVQEKLARVSVGSQRYYLTVKPAPYGDRVRLGSSHGGDKMIDVSLDAIRQFANGLLELADQQEGVVRVQAEPGPTPGRAEVDIGSLMHYDGERLVVHDNEDDDRRTVYYIDGEEARKFFWACLAQIDSESADRD